MVFYMAELISNSLYIDNYILVIVLVLSFVIHYQQGFTLHLFSIATSAVCTKLNLKSRTYLVSNTVCSKYIRQPHPNLLHAALKIQGKNKPAPPHEGTKKYCQKRFSDISHIIFTLEYTVCPCLDNNALTKFKIKFALYYVVPRRCVK